MVAKDEDQTYCQELRELYALSTFSFFYLTPFIILTLISRSFPVVVT